MKFDTTEARSKVMQTIKSKNTKEELLLGKAMWNVGLRYRKNNKSVFGCPDFTFKKNKVAIFVDGEFFHGYNWEEKKQKIKANRDYWIPKIERNIKRDKEVTKFLEDDGWLVLRFWSSEVKKELNKCLTEILKAIESAQNKKIRPFR